jgi:CzcA family heavy metal efflux pump
MSFVARLRAHASVVLVVTLGLAALGVVSLRRLPTGIYPDVDFPRIQVVAHAGNASPELVETQVTRVLEEALVTIPGAMKVRSRTIRGAVEISLLFRPGTDMWRALQLAQTNVERARPELPADTTLIVERVTVSAVPVITFNVAGGDARDLRELAERVVRPAIAGVPGVGNIEVQGGDTREVEVILRPDALAALKLTPTDVADRLAAQDQIVAAGRLPDEKQTLTVLVDAQAGSADALAARPIAEGPTGAVPLSAVADVREGREDRTLTVAGPAGDVVVINVARAPGASAPEVALGARRAVAALRKSGAIPAGTSVQTVYDQSLLIADAMASVRDALLIGVALALVVMAAFLRNVRAGVAAAVAVPTTLITTFAAMRAAGQTLNLMSLGGLAVAIGLVVDDAIVVVEAIVRRLEEGLEPHLAAERGTRDLIAAVAGTTLTTVVVFAPLGLLAGIVGTFFGALAATLCAAVLLSLVFSVTLTPLAAGWLLRPHAAAGRTPRLSRAYARVLGKLVHQPLLALGLVAALAAGGLLAWNHLATGFLPPMDEGTFVIDFFMPSGTSLEETDRIGRRIDAVLASTPEIVTFTRRTGAEMGPAVATQQNRGDILVRLVPRSRRPPIDDVIDGVRKRLADEVPEVRVEFMQVLQDVLDDLAGTPRPIEVHVTGADPRTLEDVAVAMGEKLEPLKRLEDFFDGVEGDVPVLRLVPDAAVLGRLGLDPARLAEDLAILSSGRVVAELRRGDRVYGVRVRAPDEVRFDAQRLAGVPLAYGGAALPLGALVHESRPLGPAVLTREALRPSIVLAADVPDGDLGGAEREVLAALHGVKLPDGVSYAIGGKAEGARQTRSDLAGVLALGSVLVLVVLLVQLRSLRLALLVLASAPVGLVGALATLVLTGTALDASSLMGCVLLAGLVVKNGILLIEHALKQPDVPFADALVIAGERRLRPILMTTLATLAGLAPLALGLGAGAELQRPLALAVIGGLVVSTIVTLVALPSLAALLMRRATLRAWPSRSSDPR